MSVDPVQACATVARRRGASIESELALWPLFGFRLALPQSLQHFSAFVLRRSILSICQHSIEQKHEPRETRLSGIKAAQRVRYRVMVGRSFLRFFP
jgi:hypothetical protein